MVNTDVCCVYCFMLFKNFMQVNSDYEQVGSSYDESADHVENIYENITEEPVYENIYEKVNNIITGAVLVSVI